MKLSAPLATAAIILAAIAQPASAAPGAYAKAKRRTGLWEVTQGEFAGRQTCMAMGLADQSTFLMLKLDTSHMTNHVIALLFGNTAWSIKEGDDLGELQLHAGDETVGATAVAAEHGFFLYMSLERAQLWFDKTKGSDFWLERNGEEIGRYRGGDLAEAFRKTRACGEKLIKNDPFAELREPKPPSISPAMPTIEAASIPPKPTNLGSWMEALEKDYFAGPVGGSDIELRHDRRNSTPAALRFKLTINEQGKMVGCEVLASSGLSDWSSEFCSLAERHPLTFTPAVSATGKPVRGEYVTSAVVAFE